MKKALFKIPLSAGCFLLLFNGADAQNIGIGTSSPSALLEVAGGDAKINQLTVGQGGGRLLTNVVLGDSALYNNTTGTSNTAIGTRALFKNTTGAVNVAIGRLTLQNNITGIDNTAIGGEALTANDSGSINTAVGDWCLLHNTSGNYNTGIGGRALLSNTTGIANTATGLSALRFALSGNYNTAMGYAAGVTIITGTGNTLVGSLADVTVPGLSNAGAIGFNAKVAVSNSFVIGGTGTEAVNVGINTTAPAERLHVNGAIKMADGGYAGVTNNAAVPVPSGGAGTIIFYENHFYGWNGTLWKQLDN